jgi:hypothetical protein
MPLHMKKIFLFILLFGFYSSKSQVTHSISLGPDLGLPGKNFGSEATLGIGGSIEYQAKFRAPIAIHFHAGYSHFSNKVLSDDKVDFLPIRIGVAGFIYKDQLFISADAGVSHFSASTGTNQTGFSFGIGPGFKFYLNPESKQFLQLSAYYNLHNYDSKTSGQNYSYTWFNIRVAYGFSFR